MTGYAVDRFTDEYRISPDYIVTVGRDGLAKITCVWSVPVERLKEADVAGADLSRSFNRGFR